MNGPEPEPTGLGRTILLWIVVLVLLPFLPLLLSLAEHSIFGTNRVENFCKMIGVHAILGNLYRAVLRAFGF
jgi:hypothetical protein